MFDNLVAAHGPTPRRRARTIVVTTSVIVHAAALAALAIFAMWKVDKLDLDARGTRVNALTLPHDSGGGGRPKVALKPKPPEVVKRPAIVPVQPTKVITKEDPQKTDAETEGGQALGDSETPGNGTGGDGLGQNVPTGPKCEGAACLGASTGTGGHDEEVTCKKGETKIDNKCVKKKEVAVVSPDIASGLRKSGNDQIPAPQSVRVSMMHEGKSRAVGTVKLCIGDDGHIDRASLLKSTGYDAYDDLLLEEMSKWRYKPYTVDGDPVPFCTAITVVYVMK